MPVSFQNGAIIEALRSLVLAELADEGDTTVIVPDDFAIDQYPFSSADLPLTTFAVYSEDEKDRYPAAFDYSHYITLCIYHIRARNEPNATTGTTDILTEDIVRARIDAMKAYFAGNRRLYTNGKNTVQDCMVTNSAIGPKAVRGVDFIHPDQLDGMAVGVLELKLWWIENSVTS